MGALGSQLVRRGPPCTCLTCNALCVPQVNLTVSGASLDEFSTGLATIWIGAMADLVSLPTEFVTIKSVSIVLLSSTRKLQASTADRLAISTRFASSDPKSTTAELQAAQSNGELEETLNSMNLTLVESSLNVCGL